MTHQPIFLATWPFGLLAAQRGYEELSRGASVLEAIERAANVTEDDVSVTSVGTGGMPNAEGVIELDAAIMGGPEHEAGAVASLTGIVRPISVARMIGRRTPHTMLVGHNARRFAIQNGAREGDLQTENSRARYAEWLEQRLAPQVAHFDEPASEPPRRPSDTHDTIGLVARDSDGNIGAGCTTSGMAWKVPGRVGDSPIIGSGLYADNEVGAAAATGHGDEIMKVCLSYRVVHLMELGMGAEEACVAAIRYLLRKRPPERHGDYGAAVIAVRKDGDVGSCASFSGFESGRRGWVWARADDRAARLIEGPYASLAEFAPIKSQD
ncbi:MAG: N(4)-(beta-N-acetylglucosaminyl)-L-asparaginase [Armatimonadetes bacterium]|nr:N(4)-(beta-N-acetylglucosaminyl)-L-asparaginase [Armatimonadota bacterium]MDE2205421.1 N(4)-(beta-N-acetylglucosaminyl)-L-asparaginase [Armatimonadota bacterium]